MGLQPHFPLPRTRRRVSGGAPPPAGRHRARPKRLVRALTHKLGYLSKADIKRVREAYKFADEAHLGQFRASGEPYITHPIAVAGMCAEWKLDAQAIMAALMHDAMEDCGVTKVELIERFGATTADLVDGLTKLDKLQFSTKEESQAESFRKMLLAMARDVRVILIKLADRLHNMRTMESMAPHKPAHRPRDLDIYAPIAHRLGLNQTYRELQELSFQYIHPVALCGAQQGHAARARLPARPRRRASRRTMPQAFTQGQHEGGGAWPREDAVFDLQARCARST
jgi:guanosine-3',5'-bis(diphosphate) 3'-pyrophosphohydrolase